MQVRPIIWERHDSSFGAYYRATQILVHENSDFQELIIFATEDHGRIFLADGLMMLTEQTHYIYHELMAHVVVNMHPSPKRVLIIGGGDGGVATEFAKYDCIDEIVLVEIDRRVVELCETYFPEISAGLASPKVSVICEDGASFVENSERLFDVCVIDSTDPYIEDASGEVLASPLISPQFHAQLSERLGDGGLGVQIAGHPYFGSGGFRRVLRVLGNSWKKMRPLLMPAPFYVSGDWIGLIYSNGAPLNGNYRHAINGACRYYNEDIHHGALCVPNDLKHIMERELSHQPD